MSDIAYKTVFYIGLLAFVIGTGGIVLIVVVAIYVAWLVFRFLVFLAKKIINTIKTHRQNKKSENYTETPKNTLTTTQQKVTVKVEQKSNKSKYEEKKTDFYIGGNRVSLDEYAKYCDSYIEHKEEMEEYGRFYDHKDNDEYEKDYANKHQTNTNIENYAAYCNRYLRLQDRLEKQ